MKKIMLALSTFRRSEKTVELALEKAVEGKALVVTFVVDVNVARYLVGTDAGLFPDLIEKCEQEFLREHRERAEEKVKQIVKMAEERGVTVRTYVSTGRFGLECMKVVEKEKPELIVTTRSRRPAWVRRFFGSPVDYLIANAGCPVLEA